MRNKVPKLRVYNLGEGYATTREGKPVYSWPYRVDYMPGYQGGDFYLGKAMCATATVVS